MPETDFAFAALICSILLSLLTEELAGVTCGGLLVPGMLALQLTDPHLAAETVLLSLLTYLCVNFLLSRWMLLYGKRKRAVTLLVSLLLFFLFSFFYPASSFPGLDGVLFPLMTAVTPAFLAAGYYKQGIAYTLGTCALLSGICRAAALLLTR